MASKKITLGSNAVLFALLTIGILVMVNYVSSRFFTRTDLTEDQIYTISDASKKLVRSLPDRLTIKAFISSDLPAQIQGPARYLRDILQEFATYSNGKVHWEVLDPSKDDKIKQQARRLKVMEAELSVYGKSKASVSASFLGVAFQYEGKVESIPFVTDINNLEYQIASTIRRLTTNKKKVGFTSGHGEVGVYRGLQALNKQLKDYDVTTVDLSKGKNTVPEDVDVLVMAGPTKALAERAKYELDQFLMRGKSLIVLMDGMTLQTPRGQMMPGRTPPRIAQGNVIGIRKMLKYWGVKLGEDLVMDPQDARVVLPVGDGRRVITNYPGFPVVTDMNRKNPITRHLKAFVPIFPSSLELTKAVKEGKGKLKGVVLASTTKQSWRQTGFFLFNPMQQPRPTKDRGPFALAVYLQGEFPSFFAGKKVPEPGPARITPPEKEQKPDPKGKHSKKSARLAVVADADFVKDQYLGLNPANMVLLLNMIDYMAEDESLISIRAKGQTRRPLRLVDDSTMALAKYLNIIGLPGVFIFFGVLRWRWQKVARRREADKILETA